MPLGPVTVVPAAGFRLVVERLPALARLVGEVAAVAGEILGRVAGTPVCVLRRARGLIDRALDLTTGRPPTAPTAVLARPRRLRTPPSM